ncbi:DUF1963 domain-containing protein [Actibacterium lipolyticum]|uniref:DUF1963 domain-containing protein n=1 Tax=Actibacterium lipolyticum TaxID=1524263 RepID=A0A238JJ64_9RHOB|nr:YwqG family protein [Actibacterium lipolyticum]SMX30720.1 hypothetical protein COL8621_00081 [Actibacterium lipolyticum]
MLFRVFVYIALPFAIFPFVPFLKGSTLSIVLLPVLIILIAILVGLSIREAMLRRFGSKATRLLLKFRWYSGNPRHHKKVEVLADKIAEHFNLTFDASDPEEAKRLETMFKSLRATNRTSPPVFQYPLSPKRLLQKLAVSAERVPEEKQLQFLNLAFAVNARTLNAGTNPGILARMARSWNRLVSDVLWQKKIRHVEELAQIGKSDPGAHWYLYYSEEPRTHGGKPAKPKAYLWAVATSMFNAVDMAERPVNVRFLPLGYQRRLIALGVAIEGSDRDYERKRRSHRKFADILRRARQLVELTEEGPAPCTEAQEADQPSGEIAALLDAQSVPGIYLRRLWPIGQEATGHSYLGGRPCLPSSIAWPLHGETGLPMHFLAQIDCSDLPKSEATSVLPAEGQLMFFADLDEEMVWEDTPDAPAATRVVYVPADQVTNQEAELPDLLPEINHAYGEPSGYFARKGVKEYAKWPVTYHPVNTFSMSPDQERSNPDLASHAQQALNNQLSGLLPEQQNNTQTRLFSVDERPTENVHHLATDDAGKPLKTVSFDPSSRGPRFPYCGAVIKGIGLALAQEVAQRQETMKLRAPKNEEEQARNDATSRDLNDLLEEINKFCSDIADTPDKTPLEPEMRKAVIDWLQTQARHGKLGFHIMAERAIGTTLLQSAQKAVTDKSIRDCLGPEVFSCYAGTLAPSPNQSEHILLGATQSKTNSTEQGGIKLLTLDSDYGMGFMFCDLGMAEFWIMPEDLKELRFDRAYGATAGF